MKPIDRINQFTTLQENDIITNSLSYTKNIQLGNRLFDRMIAKTAFTYGKLSNAWHRQLLMISIIMAIHKNDGRFVRMTDDGRWIKLSKNEAYSFTARELEQQATITKMMHESSKLLQAKYRRTLITKHKMMGKKRLLLRRLSDEKHVTFGPTLT
jgi:hypothetical protein